MVDRDESLDNKGADKAGKDFSQNKKTDNRSKEEREYQEQKNDIGEQLDFKIPHRERSISLDQIKYNQKKINSYSKEKSIEDEKDKSSNTKTRLIKDINQLRSEQGQKYIIKDVKEISAAADFLAGRKGGGDRSTNLKDLEREISNMMNRTIDDFDIEAGDTTHKSKKGKIKRYFDDEIENKESEKEEKSEKKESEEESEHEDSEEEQEKEEKEEKEEKNESDEEESELDEGDEEETEPDEGDEEDFEKEEIEQEPEEEIGEPDGDEEAEDENENESMDEDNTEEVRNEMMIEDAKHTYEESQKELEEKIEHLKNEHLSDHDDEGSDGLSHHK